MRKKEQLLSYKTRREIYAFIDINPGLNLRELSRKMNIPRSTIRYHLKHFKKHGIIEIKSEGQYKKIYSINKVGNYDKQILSLLRQRIPCQIFLYFLFNLIISKKDISVELEISPTTTNYHIKKFLDMDIIEEVSSVKGRLLPYNRDGYKDIFFKRKPIGREIFYRRKNQKIIDDLYRILITYKNSLPNKDLIETYMEYYINLKSKLGLVLPKGSSEEDLWNIFFEFYKPPFAY